MSVLLPFRALHYPDPAEALFVPGQQADPPIHAELLIEHPQPCLFLYRQRFDNCMREGVIGILNRSEAKLYRHEETCPDRVAACARRVHETGIQTSAIWAWCNHFELPALHSPSIEVMDKFGCLHQIEAISDTARISRIQASVQGKIFFLADGHHRFAAGWTLICIQIRNESLRSRRPPPLDEIEAAALRGHLLPPKSTDFYPKLAAGLVMVRCAS